MGRRCLLIDFPYLVFLIFLVVVIIVLAQQRVFVVVVVIVVLAQQRVLVIIVVVILFQEIVVIRLAGLGAGRRRGTLQTSWRRCRMPPSM
ncbi:MAG: hypothetical protein QF512_01815 [Alphaproteobacteria bacterium]|nr:hypothetical protein [Alphaproteobacteria bacterium]